MSKMSNTKLIKALRCKSTNVNDCTLCAFHNACYDGTLESIAADVLEADRKFLAEFIKNIEHWKKQVIRLRAQLPKEGEWITDYDGFEYDVHCSVCGEEALIKEGGSHDHAYSRYCPNCGAKMTRGEQEDAMS